MNQIYRKSPFWSLAGPLLGYLAIQWGVQALIQFVVELPYIMRTYAQFLSQDTFPDMNQAVEACLKALEPAFETLLRHQVEIAGAAAACTLFLTAPLFFSDRKKEKKYFVEVLQKQPLKKYWTLLVFGVFGCAAATCLMTMVQLAFYDVQYEQTARVLYSAPVAVQLLLLGIVVPLAEEMMFRGLLFRRYRERQRFWYSAVCSSVFFALMHTNTTQSVYAFLLGLMLAYVYDKFGSLKAPVFLHMVLNTCSVIFTELGAFGFMAAEPMRMAITAIAGAFICSVIFVLIQRTGGQITREMHDDRNMRGMF